MAEFSVMGGECIQNFAAIAVAVSRYNVKPTSKSQKFLSVPEKTDAALRMVRSDSALTVKITLCPNEHTRALLVGRLQTYRWRNEETEVQIIRTTMPRRNES